MANLRQEIKRAYSKTPMHKLDVLLAEETKWSRKLTIAQNKLDHVRMRINKHAKEVIKGCELSQSTITHIVKGASHGSNAESRTCNDNVGS